MFEAIIIFTMLGVPDSTMLGGPFNLFGDCERARLITHNSLVAKNPGIKIKKSKCRPVVTANG